jgi:hypothetical protein
MKYISSIFVLILGSFSLVGAQGLKALPTYIEVPQIVAHTGELVELENLSFFRWGSFYSSDKPVITCDSTYSELHPFSAIQRLLCVYQSGSIKQLLDLYSKSSQDKAEQTFGSIPEEELLSHIRSINSVKIYAIWIESVNTVLAYVELNDSKSVIPYILSFEEGSWVFRSDTINSNVADSFDSITAVGRWEEVRFLKPDLETVSELSFDQAVLLEKLPFEGGDL